MEARNVLYKFRQRGFTLKAVGSCISLAPKSLINDSIINYVRKNKNQLLAVLYEEVDEHNHRKKSLGNRVQILRVLIKNKLWPQRLSIPENEFWHLVEQELDEVLAKLGYDLEAAIDQYRAQYLDENFDTYGVCKKCGYLPTFCLCDHPPFVGIATCNQCEHFSVDSIGDGSGIGSCERGILWTDGTQGRLPLYRFAHRRCDKFSKLMD